MDTARRHTACKRLKRKKTRNEINEKGADLSDQRKLLISRLFEATLKPSFDHQPFLYASSHRYTKSFLIEIDREGYFISQSFEQSDRKLRKKEKKKVDLRATHSLFLPSVSCFLLPFPLFFVYLSLFLFLCFVQCSLVRTNNICKLEEICGSRTSERTRQRSPRGWEKNG